MITLGEMQISGMLTMLMLSVMMVLCVPPRSIRYGSFAKARWMMAAGTGLIAAQFLLQYIMGFRQMGVTQGVLLNLIFFMPASLLCGMGILYVQRQGEVERKEWSIVWALYGLSAAILLGTALLDGVHIEQDSPKLRMAEYVGALLYVVMQSYIFKQQYTTYKHLKQAVDEYYDRERGDLFGWMGRSTKALMVLVFFVPVVIFMKGTPLVAFSLAYFLCIAYSTISLYSYGISKDAERVEEAEGRVASRSSKGKTMGSLQENVAPDDRETVTSAAVEEAVEQWKASGAYCEHNLTLGVVARQMGVQQKQLQEWLRQSEYKKLAGLVASLRIEEAKRVLKEHPEWSVESVADHCGFNDRKYFHQVFLQHTGTTPAKFQQED